MPSVTRLCQTNRSIGHRKRTERLSTEGGDAVMANAREGVQGASKNGAFSVRQVA
jgi:hypothetical protein